MIWRNIDLVSHPESISKDHLPVASSKVLPLCISYSRHRPMWSVSMSVFIIAKRKSFVMRAVAERAPPGGTTRP